VSQTVGVPAPFKVPPDELAIDAALAHCGKYSVKINISFDDLSSLPRRTERMQNEKNLALSCRDNRIPAPFLASL
jgi:hypothetical protein